MTHPSWAPGATACLQLSAAESVTPGTVARLTAGSGEGSVEILEQAQWAGRSSPTADQPQPDDAQDDPGDVHGRDLLAEHEDADRDEDQRGRSLCDVQPQRHLETRAVEQEER